MIRDCDIDFISFLIVILLVINNIAHLTQQQPMLNELRVATLNFSGINTSPFEYHNGSKEKSYLNQIFQQLLQEYNNEHPDIKWDIGKLDKIFSRERYSILYRADCGFIRKKLVTKNEFEAIWDRTFDLNQGIVGHMNLKDQLVDKLRVFDWMVYKAFIISVFGKVDMDNLSQLSIEKYREELRKWHSQAFLNQDKKIDNVRDYIVNNQIDVMFLQQALNKRMMDLLPNDDYGYVKNQDSMIIYRKQQFFKQSKQDVAFHQKYKDKLNFNKDSVYLKSKQFLLISVHLTSKGTNIDQARQMFQVLNQIQNQYKELFIIIGADANHDILKLYNFKAYPDNHAPTTRKKRTHMQCQFEKSGKLIQETKDLIISNYQAKSWKIGTIKQLQISGEMLPNNDHPYDHFVVSSSFDFQRSQYPKLEKQAFSTMQIRMGGSIGFDDIYPFSRTNTFESFFKVEPVFIRRRTYAQQNEYQPLQIYKYVSNIQRKQSTQKGRKLSFDFHK